MTTADLINAIKAGMKKIGVAANIGINRNSHPYGVAIYCRPRGKSFWTLEEATAAFSVATGLGLLNHGHKFEDDDIGGYCSQQGMNYLVRG
jgi:hypothetical protein